MILDVHSVDRDLRLEAEVCVIGSGAGGSVVADELAAAGRSVVVLEEGSYWTSRDFTEREEEMYPRLYRERATKPTGDYAVLVSQGRALGGSTVVSFCLCFRTPRRVLDEWRERAGLETWTYEALFPHFEAIEATIGAKPMTAGELNENNRVLQRGSERLGYRGHLLTHNRSDCVGCGYCALGCAYDRKGDALRTFLPRASRNGAKILPDVHVEKILHERKRATGVGGWLRSSHDGRRHAVHVECDSVVLAAGALESPMLWFRSGLPDRGDVAGKNLRLQPYAVVAGLFDRPIRAWEGAPQGYVVDEFLNLEKREEGGFLLFSASAPPVTTAGLLPGLGEGHRRLMMRYEETAGVAFFLDDRSTGRVRADRRGRTVIDYRLGDADRAKVRSAISVASRVLFAAGAGSVVLPYNEIVEAATREAADEAVEERGILANDPLFLSYQPQGTLRMGLDPGRAVVDPEGRAHGMRNLWVADASVFPTAVAVPPQLSVMAVARRTAQALLRST